MCALKDVTLSFPERGLVFIVGRSGSGKTTLLNLIGGLDRPSAGEVIVDGKPTKDFGTSDYEIYRNMLVGYVYQEYNLIGMYSVGANIALAGEMQGRKVSCKEVDELLRKLELVDSNGLTLYDRKISDLSGGQKQRVSIARALIKRPEILLADEPTGALDSKTGEKLYELLEDLSRDRLIVVVTHDDVSAEEYGERIIELEDGCVISERELGKAGKQTPKPDRERVKKYTLGRLPWKKAAIMGAALPRHKFRLVISAFWASLPLSCGAFLFIAANPDSLTAELNNAYSNGTRMAFPGVDTEISCQFTASDGTTATVAGTTKAFSALADRADKGIWDIHAGGYAIR